MAELTKKERERLLARAEKLKPKPVLLPSGSWRCQVTLDGRRESVTASTPDEAHAKAVALRAGYIQRTKDPLSLTVRQAVEFYVENKNAVLSPSTIKGYNKIKNNLMTGISDIKLAALAQPTVQKWVNDLAKDHSAKTVKNAHGLLSAVVREYCPSLNLHTTLPQRDAKQIEIPTEDEIKLIIQAAKGTEMELPILLAIWLGLRASEIRGLRWNDFQGNRLHICRAIVDGADGPTLKKTKTVAGDRRIKVPRYIAMLIKSMPQNGEYIVKMSGTAMYLRFSRLCKRIGVPHYRFHDLRHTAASVSVLLGVPTKYSQRRMGHATDNMLKTVYEHTMRDKEDKYADLIDEYYESIIAHDIAHENPQSIV